MTHYRSNVRDIEFNLFEVLDRESSWAASRIADLDRETVSALLAEADHLARTKLADSFADGDRQPAGLRPADPHGDAARGVQDFLPGADRLRSLGARSCPPSSAVRSPRPRSSGRSTSSTWAPTRRGPLHRRAEVRLRALGVRHRAGPADRPDHDRAAVGRHHGADRAGRRLRRRRRADPGGPAAGRHLAPRGRQAVHHRRRARPDREHRPSGAGAAASAPVPGTKGLSLFIVPKYHFDLETGELTGERNGVFATNAGEEDGHQGLHHLRADLRRRRARRRLAARRGAQRHRPDVPGDRARPDAGRHQGDRHLVHRLPERAGVRQDTGPGPRPDPGGRQDRAAGDHHPPPRRPALADDPEVVRRGAAGAGALHRQHSGPGRDRPGPGHAATRPPSG